MALSKENAPQDFKLGGEILEGADEAGKLPARIDRYSSARARARDMVTHLTITGQLPDERAYMRDCGEYLLFNHYYTVGKVRLAAMKSCDKHLLCPLCAIRRGAKALKSYLDRLEVIRADQPQLRAYLVTFAVRNGDDLVERYKHLQHSLQKLHKRRSRWLSGGPRDKYTEAAKAAGAVWSYEVTNIGNGWHPHVHAIWLCQEVPDEALLRAEWEEITGDSWTVDCRPIVQDSAAEGFCEVFKYAMKFSELSLDHNIEAYCSLRGRRLVGSFGAFRGVQVPPGLTDELLDDLPFIQILYRYAAGSGYSVQSTGHSEPVKARAATA